MGQVQSIASLTGSIIGCEQACGLEKVPNECIPEVFGNSLVPWSLDVGVAKMNFTKAELTENTAAIDLDEFCIMGLTMCGTFFADIGGRAESCACTVPKWGLTNCGGRFEQKAEKAKWGIRIVMNLYKSLGARLKVVIHDIDLFRCPVSLNRIIAEDRLNAALETNLTEHVTSKIEECSLMSKVQSLVVDDENCSYAKPPKQYQQ